jgi:putative DNA primase/helicase
MSKWIGLIIKLKGDLSKMDDVEKEFREHFNYDKGRQELFLQNQHQETLEQQLTKKYHFKSMKDTKEIYYYDPTSGIYLKDAEWLIEQECIKDNPDARTNNVNDIKNRIIWANYTDRESFNPDINWLCCSNVMVNIRTGEIKEHNPNFMATVQIPDKLTLYLTPCVPGPTKILKFLHEVMDSYESAETVLDYIAYCLLRGYPFHKWILFLGSGRNGKGVTTELITRFLGYDNVSNETLERLLDNNFATANLVDKLANIDADLSSNEVKKTGMLKKLTGNDSIPGEIKFKSAFHFKNTAKFIFSANQIPITNDETDAYFSRPLIVNFPNQYLGKDADPYLIDKLTTPEEMSALLSLILKRLPRVLKYGISSNSTIEDTYNKYMESSDPIRLFIELAISRQDIENYWETKDDVYNAYVNFCTDKNLPKESNQRFSRELTNDGFDYKQKRIDGVKTDVWIKMQLKQYKKVDQDQETLK